MLNIEIPGLNTDEDENMEVLNSLDHNSPQDQLNEEIREKKRIAIHYITSAAKLIASRIDEEDIIQGYQWIIDSL